MFRLSGMVKFVDLEFDGEETTQTEDVRAAYLAAVAEHTARFVLGCRRVCRRNRVELVPVDTGRPAAEVLVDYLNSRGRVASAVTGRRHARIGMTREAHRLEAGGLGGP